MRTTRQVAEQINAGMRHTVDAFRFSARDSSSVKRLRRGRRYPIVAAAAAGLIVAGCGGSSAPSATTTTMAPTVVTTTTTPTVTTTTAPRSTTTTNPETYTVVCAINVPADGMLKLSMPNTSPFTLIVEASLNANAGQVSQVQFAFDGKTMREYKANKQVAAVPKGGASYGLEFENINVFSVFVFNRAFTQKEIEKVNKMSLNALLHNDEGIPQYRWPDMGVYTPSACLSNHVPYMSGSNISFAPVEIGIGHAQST